MSLVSVPRRPASSSTKTRSSENSSESTYEDRKAEYARILERAKQAIKRLED